LGLLVLPLLLYLSVFGNGKIDGMYNKLINHGSDGLVLGSSRASVDIDPKYFEKSLGKKLLNFSFSLTTSDYGPVYLEALSKKLNTNNHNQLFILEVNPLNLSLPKNVDEYDYENFPESDNFLNGLYNMNMSPNFQYLFKYYEKPLYYLVIKNLRPLYGVESSWISKLFGYDYTYTFSNGRVAIRVPKTKNKTTTEIINKAQEHTENRRFSISRYQYLDSTISYLNTYGKVFLIRTPIDSINLLYENNLIPEFDSLIREYANKYNTHYINYSGDFFWMKNSADGHHMDFETGNLFTIQLIDSIKYYY
jgi:hypothetical protein